MANQAVYEAERKLDQKLSVAYGEDFELSVEELVELVPFMASKGIDPATASFHQIACACEELWPEGESEAVIITMGQGMRSAFSKVLEEGGYDFESIGYTNGSTTWSWVVYFDAVEAVHIEKLQELAWEANGGAYAEVRILDAEEEIEICGF